MRFIVFALFFYLIYFLLKALFLKPFRQGYAQGERKTSNKGWKDPFKKNEGDVTITYNPEKEKDNKGKIGEYVDYEEVKD